MRMPNLNALRMFDAAARHLNFRRAAEELNLTQGAVAQQVRRLEVDLGVQLFHRRARGLELTSAGRDYQRPIQRAFSLIEEATRHLHPPSMRVTVSVTPSFASKWLVPRLARFAEIHPDIDLRTVASEELADLRTDEVDIAVRQGMPPFGDGLPCTLLAPLDLHAVCSPAYAGMIGAIGQIVDFSTHALIQDSHNHWTALFERADVPPPSRILRFNQTALAMDAAVNGQGIALAPRLLVADDLEQGRLMSLWEDSQPDRRGFYIVTANTADSTGSRSTVIEWIVSEIAPGPGTAQATPP